MAMFEDGIQEAVSTLVTRDFNYAGIVYNPQVRSVNALLLKAVEHLVQRTSYISIEEFARSDDYSVLAALSKCGKSDPELRKLVDCLISGRLLPYIKAKGAKMINWERLGALNSEFLARLQNLAEKASRADPIDTQRKSLQEFYNFLSQSRQKVEEGLKKKLGCKTIIVDIPPPPKVRELDALMMIKGRSMLLRSAYPALQGVEVSAAKRWSVLAFADVAVTDRTAFEAFEKGVEELETNP
ncbi:MAG: hypothetical protein H3Z54_10110 [archaeon]|nr:hypothetical protein [archaeon]